MKKNYVLDYILLEVKNDELIKAVSEMTKKKNQNMGI